MVYIVAFSGGKDSVAMVLHLLEIGVPKESIHLHHHDVDGGGKNLNLNPQRVSPPIPMIYITTEETFFLEAPTVEAECPICLRQTTLELVWVVARCQHCGGVHDLSFTMPDLVRLRRERMGLTRRRMGELMGYAPASVKHYEFVRCTKPYYQASGEAILKHEFKKQQP